MKQLFEIDTLVRLPNKSKRLIRIYYENSGKVDSIAYLEKHIGYNEDYDDEVYYEPHDFEYKSIDLKIQDLINPIDLSNPDDRYYPRYTSILEQIVLQEENIE